MYCVFTGNIAQNKTTMNSSEYCVGCHLEKNPSGHPFHSSLAVDGNITDRIHDSLNKYFGKCARTESDTIAWWMVDFGRLYTVLNITTFGNTDG